MPCAGLGIVIIVMFYPLPRFLAVSVLSLDSYIGFAVPCRFHTIRAVKFSVTVVAYYPAAKRARILDANLYFIDSIGLTEHLSPTRSNGLLAMVKQIKMYALAYKTKEQQQQ